MSPHLALVPARPLGPRSVGLVGELRIGSDVRRPFDEQCELHPRAGNAVVGAVHERCDDLRIDLDAHGSVQADGALVVTLALRIRHPEERDGSSGLEAETTVVAADVSTPFLLACHDGHGCRAVASGTVTNAPSRRVAG